jgi:hypothetical protein
LPTPPIREKRLERGKLDRAANQARRLMRQLRVARRHSLTCGRRVGGSCARCGDKCRTLIIFQPEAISELLGELARRATHAGLDLFDRVDGAEGLLRQRLLGQVACLAQPPQQAAKYCISFHQ